MRNHSFRLLLPAVILLFASASLHAQTFPFRIGGTGADVINAVDHRADGQIYVTGAFSGTACFNHDGGGCLISAGGTDGFLAIYDVIGNLLFNESFGGPGHDRGLDIAWADEQLYVVGEFAETAEFRYLPDNTTIFVTSNGGLDAFVAAWTWTGLDFPKIVQVVPFGGTGDDTAQDLAVTATGVAVTGGFTGSTNFDPLGPGFTIPSAGQHDVFVAAYDTLLGFDYMFKVGATGDDLGNGIDADGAGMLYVTGAFERRPDFDPGPNIRRILSYGGRDAFVAVYNAASGTPTYVRAFHLGGTTHDAGSDIAAAGAGKLFVTGQFTGTASLDPGGALVTPSNGGDDGFLGGYQGTGGSATTLWAFPLGSPGLDAGLGLDLDECSAPVVTGAFSGTVDFDPGPGTVNRTASGATDAFIAGYTDAGALRFANQVGGPQGDVGQDVTVRPSGESVGVGSFSRNATLTDVGFPLMSAGALDGYAVVYNVNGRRLVEMCGAPPPEMVGWWDFDARSPVPGPPSTFFDLTAPPTPPNNGVPQGTTWALAPGPVTGDGLGSTGLAFNTPGDRVRIPSHPSLAWGMNDLTIDAWVKPAPGAVEGQVIPILSNVNATTGAGYEFILAKREETDQWNVALYYRDDFGFGDLLYTTVTMPPDVWYLMGATLDRDAFEPPFPGLVILSLNVAQQGFNTIAGSVGQASQSGPVYIGNRQVPVWPFLTTTDALFEIDEVELFHRELSTGGPFELGEIRDIYNLGKCRPCWTAAYQLGGALDGEDLTDSAPPEEAHVTETHAAFELEQNAPNPFRGTTEIRFTLPEAAEVRLTLYDLMGRIVATLTEGPREAGTHTVGFDATQLATGVYLYRLEAADRILTRRMVIMR